MREGDFTRRRSHVSARSLGVRRWCSRRSRRRRPKLDADSEASHLLRPTASHRDLSRPQPRRLLVDHIHDGEAAEVLLGLD